MEKPLIIALDFETNYQCEALLENLDLKADKNGFVKIGLELFVQYGYDIIKALQSRQLKIFLDLKLCDIPNTVERTCALIAKWQVEMLTIHASGGAKMIQAAKRGLSSAPNQTKLLVVTQLTSLSESEIQNELNIPLTSQENVLSLAKLAAINGADGVICSAQEVPLIKQQIGPNFLCITPGIRPKWSATNEQQRIVTPKEARELGSDGIVIGRPITAAKDSHLAYQTIVKEWYEYV